jgi:uncharacterized protein (TIGR02453 family)
VDTSSILEFLKKLQVNNNKAWMDLHKSLYQEVRTELLSIADFLIQKTATFDPPIGSLQAKNCIFRINRDIRFSKDKTLYKTYMGLFLAKEGKNSRYAGYYLHLAPNDQSFIAGGLYEPTAPVLNSIRQEIDYNSNKLNALLSEENFKKLFGGLQGEKLQRPPKGYFADHPYIEWLKLKSFTVSHPVKDIQVAQKGFVDYIFHVFEVIHPLNEFLNAVIDG